jgi:hypothetical protein
MIAMFSKKTLVIALLVLAAITALAWGITANNATVDYSAQVKPIINKHCITCHGGVKAKGNFSLLFREEALAKTKSGKPAIIPGDPGGSEMIRRLTLSDPDERMPYHHEPLSKDEIDILTKWVREGAPWGENWSYVPLKPVDVPKPTKFFGLMNASTGWEKNEVDYFIQDKLKEEKLQPSPQADKATLLKRVSLDITGMPAPDALAEKYLQDNSQQAYEELVDSLLASPRYGEKWTAMWLDLARYADTKGYERDDVRSIWRYRDWLIRAFNSDMPYDEFIKEQIAGDLLPNPTDNQFIATAFHRNTMTNDEGGTENEEFRTSAVLDRVNTTWNAVMGTTFACVQCHSHPYDPFKHDEYYKFMAFFNDTRDEDSYADYPLLRTYDTLEGKVTEVVNWLKTNASPQKAKEAYTFLKTWQPAINSLVCDSFTNSELNDTKWAAFRNNALCRLKGVSLTGKDHLIFRYQGYASGGIWQIHVDAPTGPIIATIPLPVTETGWEIRETDITPVSGMHNLYFTYVNSNLKKPTESGTLLDWLYFTEQFPGKDKSGYADAKAEYWKLLTTQTATTPIMMDNPAWLHRTSNVFERGNWLVKGEKVEPDVPHSLNPFPEQAPRNRLGLAEWMVSKDNPLVSRTMVNRVWEQLFGTGLAETLEDLGTQGIPPTHLQLLNWLSFKFMNDDKWSVKQLVKTVVMSAAYQQSSKASAESMQKDPYNKYYSRGPRVRLAAEEVRDQALCIAGVMSNKMYGPGVMPYQPNGIWLSPWNGQTWVQSKGEDQYRRAVYTFWKRSAAYPSMLTFDGVSREVCTARRIRTNTPLQALTTLNDSAFIDIARQFAFRIQNTTKSTDIKQQITTGFKLATYHDIDDKSLQALLQLYNLAYTAFNSNAAKTCDTMGGMSDRTNPQTAALVVVANAILNLDEVVTKN